MYLPLSLVHGEMGHLMSVSQRKYSHLISIKTREFDEVCETPSEYIT